MLGTFGVILLGGLFLGEISQKLKLPSLVGMILLGIVIRPQCLGVIDLKVLSISSELRKIALIIILINAGLNLNIKELKKNGISTVLLSFLPATMEILCFSIFAPKIFNITPLEGAVIGSIIGAVSPAVVVPRMIRLINKKYGTKSGVPQMIVGAASVDDIFVIIIFTSLVKLTSGSKMMMNELFYLPVSIILGILIGIGTGNFLVGFFKKIDIRASFKTIIILAVSFILVEGENHLKYSSLLSVMVIGMIIHQKNQEFMKELSQKFSKIWLGAEILLFVLVGAEINIGFAMKFGLSSIILILLSLIFREFGVFLALMKSNLNKKEKLFTMISYTPKATVQAAIGGMPLMMGFSYGDLALTMAVLSILITAPFGAFLMDLSYDKLLDKDE